MFNVVCICVRDDDQVDVVGGAELLGALGGLGRATEDLFRAVVERLLGNIAEISRLELVSEEVDVWYVSEL